MRKIYEGRSDAAGVYSGVTLCHLQIYQATGGIVVIAAEVPDPGGPARPALSQCAAELAHAVWQAHGAPTRFTWIEQYPTAQPAAERFALVQFVRQPEGEFTDPVWQAVTPESVAALVAQAYNQDWPAGWFSLPLQGLRLECTGCGQPLGVAAILAGARRCPRCRDQVGAALVHPGPRLDAQEVRRLRQEARQRIIRQEEKLGLSTDQRARVFRILVGVRSLWDLRPDELQTLVMRLEQFRDAAEVQSFLDTHGIWATGPESEAE